MQARRCSMSDFSTPISQHKLIMERKFCGCVLSMRDNVLLDCFWLSPDIFSDPNYKKFWQDVRNGKDATEAAINAKIYSDLTIALSEVISSLEYLSYSQAISDDAYILSLAKNVPLFAKAIADRDLEKIRKYVQSISETTPIVIEEIPSFIDLALSLADSIGETYKVLNTNISSYDNAIGGLKYGSLNLIAARPSMGKSTFALQIARNLAANKKKVLYFSLEMTKQEILIKMVCGALRISTDDYANKKYTKEQEAKFNTILGKFMNLYEDRLLIDDRSRLTTEDIWKAVARYRPDVIIVDHISLLSDKADNEIKRLGNISWAGKQIAKTHNLAAIFLQQLNRNTEKRDNKQPTLSDLRDSGETEQNADLVTFIYRPDYYELGSNETISDTQLIIAKNRMGKRNVIANVKYHLQEQWFYTPKELEQRIEKQENLWERELLP